MEIRKAPNDTAALSFVANSEAARYVFVVVAAADVMDRGRRYDTFVLACRRPRLQPRPRRTRLSPRGWPRAVAQGGCSERSRSRSTAAPTGSPAQATVRTYALGALTARGRGARRHGRPLTTTTRSPTAASGQARSRSPSRSTAALISTAATARACQACSRSSTSRASPCRRSRRAPARRAAPRSTSSARLRALARTLVPVRRHRERRRRRGDRRGRVLLSIQLRESARRRRRCGARRRESA